jgi:thioredoxin-like negative regulator of GroEL
MINRCCPWVAVAGLALGSLTAAVPPPDKAPEVPVAVLEVIGEDQARLELARVLAYAQRYDESLTEYRWLVARRGEEAALRAEYGQVLGWAGRPAEAKTVLAAVTEEDLPPAAAIFLADLWLGDERFADSTRLYRQALAARPEDHATRFKLARVLSWQEDYAGALAEFRCLLEALPGEVQVRRHYAQVLGYAGFLDEAVEQWRRTLPAERDA